MGGGRYGLHWTLVTCETQPFQKALSGRCPQLSFLGEQRKKSSQGQLTPPETLTTGRKVQDAEVLALTLAFIFNEPFSWDFTSRKAVEETRAGLLMAMVSPQVPLFA